MAASPGPQRRRSLVAPASLSHTCSSCSETKKELFLAAVRDCFAKIAGRFEASAKTAQAAGLDADQVLEAMGHAYIAMLKADRDLLRLQLHAYAACSDPEIQTEVRAQFRELWHTVARVSGVDVNDALPVVRQRHADQRDRQHRRCHDARGIRRPRARRDPPLPADAPPFLSR